MDIWEYMRNKESCPTEAYVVNGKSWIRDMTLRRFRHHGALHRNEGK